MGQLTFYNRFGSWAIITGASSGIGEEFARQLSAMGFNLVLVARRLHLLKKLGEELKEKWKINYKAVQVDLSEADAYREIIMVTEDLDVGLLVSNAGTGRPGRFIERDKKDLLEIIHLNALSHLSLSHYYGKKFTTRGKGGIVLTGAMGATSGVPFMAIESASKSFIEGLGKALYWELKSNGVQVTVLVTTPTETPVMKALGFTKENIPSKPLTVQQCVKETLAALLRNQVTVLPGLKFRVMNALLPAQITREIMGRTMQKNNNIL